MAIRLTLELVGLAAGVVLIGVALRSCEDADHERDLRVAAERQSTVNGQTAAITDRVASERVIIIKEGEEKAREIEVIPSDDIPADVRERWIAGLRDTRAGRSNPDRPDELPGGVRGAEP